MMPMMTNRYVLASSKPTWLRLTFLAAIAINLAGCPGKTFELTDIAALDDAVLGVDERHARARVITVGDGFSTIDMDLGEGPATLHPRDQVETEVLVFTTGVPAEENRAGSLAELVRVAHDGPRGFDGAPISAFTDSDGERPGRWAFSDQYGALMLSRDGRYAMASEPLGRLVVENRVEVADLEAPPGPTNPVGLSLRSIGGETPRGFAVSAPLEAPGVAGGAPARDLRVVALLAPGQLSLFDLDAPSVPPITIPTDLEGGPSGPLPLEVAFVGSRAVVRTAGGDQLLVVGLVARDASGGGQRFDVSLSTLYVGSPVRELRVDERASSPRLLALTAGELFVFDLDAGLDRRWALSASYDRMALFEGAAPGDPTTRDRAVIFGRASSLAFVDFGEAPLDVREVETLTLDFTPDEVVADVDALMLTCFRSGGGGGHELDAAGSRTRVPAALVDLEDRSATPLGATSLDRAALSDDYRTLWVADWEGYVSRFDVDSLTQQEGWLDRSVDTLLPLPGAGGYVLAFSSVRRGDFVVLETAAESFSDFRRQRGAF